DGELKAMFSIYELNHAKPEDHWFIDGGVLDNFPFKAAIDAIGRHPAGAEVDRRLVYIEPDPGAAGAADSTAQDAKVPGLRATIIGGAAAIPRREVIIDDLERVAGRNQAVARLQDIIVK